MNEFKEKAGEKEGQRRKRFLAFLRELPMRDAKNHPGKKFDFEARQWVPNDPR